MNKKCSRITILFTMIIMVASNTLFCPGGGHGGGGGGGGHGFGGGGGGHGFGGGGGRSFSGGGGRGFSGGGAARAGGARNFSGRSAGQRGNRNVNVNRSGYGYRGTRPGIVAGTALAGTAVAAGTASSANRAAGNVTAGRTGATNPINQTSAGTASRNLGQGISGQARPGVPANVNSARTATQNARAVQSRNPQRVNQTVNQQARLAGRRGNTSWNNRPGRFNVDGRRAYGFYNNGRFYATWFWGGIPYYWYGGLWTPWYGFWDLYPWWYDYYYSNQADGMSFYNCDNNYDCPDGDCPPACLRYYD